MGKKPSVILSQNVHKDKGKAIPVQAWTGAEFCRKLGLPDFKTIGHEGGKIVSPSTGRIYPPGNIPVVYFLFDFRVTVQPERLGKRKIPTTQWEIEPATFRLVTQCLNEPKYAYSS
jgi:hypothetical protein